jgi:hypothetical protein
MQILVPLPKNVQYIHESIWGLTAAEKDRRKLDRQPLGLPQFYYHHQAGNAPNMTAATWDDNPIAWMQDMDRRDTTPVAQGGNGYKAVQYSYAIHLAPNGICSVIGGRGDRYPGATKDQNTVSKAVVFAGNYDSRYGPNTRRKPEAVEVEAGRWLTNNLVANGILAANFIGRAHRDNPKHPGATACCGDWLIPYVNYMNTPYPPVQPPSKDMNMELVNISPGTLNNGALFAINGTLIQWVNVNQWVAMGNPPATRVLSRTEAKRYLIVGIVPDGYAGIFANA